MNEVTKLYENAGILKECLSPCLINKTWRKYHDCPNCNKRKNYPPFTAEKQIAILNFCLKWGQVHLLRGIDDEYRIENYCYRQGYQPTIADAIANYINEKWEKLTPEERKQIKEILE